MKKFYLGVLKNCLFFRFRHRITPVILGCLNKKVSIWGIPQIDTKNSKKSKNLMNQISALYSKHILFIHKIFQKLKNFNVCLEYTLNGHYDDYTKKKLILFLLWKEYKFQKYYYNSRLQKKFFRVFYFLIRKMIFDII